MRILHVVPTYLPAVRYGGPIFAVHGLCQALVARGHEVEVFTTTVDGPGDSGVPVGIQVTLDAVAVRYFRCPALRRIYWSPGLGFALRSEVHRFNAVHLHSVFLWPTWAAARAARRANIPYVLSPRGMLVRELIARRSYLAKSTWIHFAEKSNLQHAAAIHLTSALELTELERFPWRVSRSVVIPNAVEEPLDRTGPIAADVRAIAAEQPLILFLGRISWKKGLDRLLRAFARTSAGKLAIVGPDDEGIATRLLEQAAGLRIADRVQILPRTVVDADKEYLFAAARLFVLPSYSENFGNAVLEAMRRSVPVVVTPEVGAAHIVEECGAGLVVAGDPEPLGAALCCLIADPSLARSMGETGQRHITAHYTWPQIAGRMEALYASLKQ
jgi:glycosyltransferase involved in cell wall biosynthesis